MPAVRAGGLTERTSRGLLLLGGTVIGSVGLILAGQQLLRHQHTVLTPAASEAVLWKNYRWSWDPGQRREAALLLATADQDSQRRRQRLLQGQAWGSAPIAAAVLSQQASTASQLGDLDRAKSRWQALVLLFPDSPLSADAAYHLSRTNPDLTQHLLKQHPAHPASLERAVETKQALHLARWGPGHHGAGGVIREACLLSTTAAAPSNDERQLLARALATLGDGQASLDCLQGAPPQPATALSIGRALLQGTQEQRSKGERLLVALTHSSANPVGATGLEAARLLSEPLYPEATLLAQLPQSLRDQSADIATAEVRLGKRKAASVFQRWPKHPASWQLQWDLARAELLAGRWQQAEGWLQALATTVLPEPLAARQRFWLGLSLAKQGRAAEAKRHWQTLLKQHPPGYYTWRASARLGQDTLPGLNQAAEVKLNSGDRDTSPPSLKWRPLKSDDALVNNLWRLGMVKEAWESWRSRHASRLDPTSLSPAPDHTEMITTGRLRLAVGDHWGGLDTLWRTSLRLVGESCNTRWTLHHLQHPRPFAAVFAAAAHEENVHEALLRAIAKQESRYSPGVRSVVGAQGLMQLMPSTATELAGRKLTDKELKDPKANSRLGARYLGQLLDQWQGNPWLTVASYNAGPGAAGGWRSDELEQDPELWSERIPYPETRIYTKKVLGNLWAYLQSNQAPCAPRHADTANN